MSKSTSVQVINIETRLSSFNTRCVDGLQWTDEEIQSWTQLKPGFIPVSKWTNHISYSDTPQVPVKTPQLSTLELSKKTHGNVVIHNMFNKDTGKTSDIILREFVDRVNKLTESNYVVIFESYSKDINDLLDQSDTLPSIMTDIFNVIINRTTVKSSYLRDRVDLYVRFIQDLCQNVPSIWKTPIMTIVQTILINKIDTYFTEIHKVCEINDINIIEFESNKTFRNNICSLLTSFANRQFIWTSIDAFLRTIKDRVIQRFTEHGNEGMSISDRKAKIEAGLFDYTDILRQYVHTLPLDIYQIIEFSDKSDHFNLNSIIKMNLLTSKSKFKCQDCIDFLVDKLIKSTDPINTLSIYFELITNNPHLIKSKIYPQILQHNSLLINSFVPSDEEHTHIHHELTHWK